MKRTFRILGMVCMAVFLSLTLNSCSDDDDSDLDSNLIGKWAYSENTSNASDWIEFHSNGKYTYTESYYGNTYTDEGTWWTSGNKLYNKVWDAEDERYYTESMYYRISGNRLYFWEDEEDKDDPEIYVRE